MYHIQMDGFYLGRRIEQICEENDEAFLWGFSWRWKSGTYVNFCDRDIHDATDHN